MIGSLPFNAHPRRKWAMGLFFLAAGVFVAARSYVSQHGQLLEVARAQVWAFPLFVVAVAVAISTVPRWISGIVLAVGLASVAYSYNYYSYVNHSIILGPLSNDSLGTQTRITRMALENHARLASGPAVAAFYKPVGDDDTALDVLRQNPSALAVIWGSTRWLNVSLSKQATAQPVSAFGGVWVAAPRTLQVVTDVPSFGLSYAPIQETTQFLSLAFSDSESALEAAARSVAPWTTYAHRGYALLRLGNLYLKQALQHETYQYGLLDCARVAYRAGWDKVGVKDNLELKSALLNNLAIATILGAHQEKDPAARAQGMRWLRGAGRIPQNLRRRSSVYYAPQIALSNFKEARDARSRKGKKNNGKR